MSGHHITTPNVYFKNLIALMILMALTVAVAKTPALDFGVAVNLSIALLIAVTKTSLVVLFFMQVKHASSLVKVFASAGFLWMVILFTLFFCDFASRNWMGNLLN